MPTIQPTTAPAPAKAPAPAPASKPPAAPAPAMAQDRIDVRPAAPAPAPAAPSETLWQKVVKRGMAGLCGLAAGAVVFIATIAALEFGIGVPAAHRILGLVAPLTSTIAAGLAGWWGYAKGRSSVD